MEVLRQYRDQWRKDLLEGEVAFWLNNSIDEENGGYFTCLDHDGTVYDETKYLWLQGRSVFMFSRLFNEVDDVDVTTRSEWLAAATVGALHLDKAKDENGLLFFSCTRDWEKLHYQRKPFSAVFYVLGFLEYYRALTRHEREGNSPPPEGTEDRAVYLEKAMRMFDRLSAQIADPTLCGRPKAPPSSAGGGGTSLANVFCTASISLDFMSTLKECNPVLFERKRAFYLGLIQQAMADCKKHYDPQRRVFMENATPHGVNMDSPAGRLFLPGHSIEVAWVLLLMHDLSPDPEAQEIALNAVEGSLELGWDSEEYGGGILYMMDVEGKPMVDATVTSNGKLWWPHCEALVATTLAFLRTGDEKWMSWLTKVHRYCYAHFSDGNGWYGYLNRDGSLLHSCKGGNYKGFFHVPRALLMCTQAVDAAVAGPGVAGVRKS